MTIRDLLENGTITLDTVVLGTLPMTADKCVIGNGSSLFYPEGAAVHNVQACVHSYSDSYSTREAAEAARKEHHA